MGKYQKTHDLKVVGVPGGVDWRTVIWLTFRTGRPSFVMESWKSVGESIESTNQTVSLLTDRTSQPLFVTESWKSTRESTESTDK